MKRQPDVTVIENGTVVDGTGAAPVADASIMVTDDTIAYAGPAKNAMQGGAIKAGQLALPMVKREK